MSDRLQELVAFARTADSGSFSKAARELGLSQPSISRTISELEARLGVKLLLRTTRRVTTTEAGAAFLERARQVIADLEAAEDAARGMDSLRGQIRIAMPVTLSVREVIPRLPPFLARYPSLQLDLVMSDDRHDLVAEGVDVAIRLGDLADSSFGARRLATLQRLVVASPDYLAARGVPRTPTDLAAHDCLFGPGSAGRRGWAFQRDGTQVSVEVDARIRANTGEGMMACARAGLGVAVVSQGMCREDLQAGAVVSILEDYALEPVAVNAVFPGGPHPSAKVRALVDYLAEAMSF